MLLFQYLLAGNFAVAPQLLGEIMIQAAEQSGWGAAARTELSKQSSCLNNSTVEFGKHKDGGQMEGMLQ